MLEDLEALCKHFFRRRYWYVSGAVHLLIIAGLYFHGPFKINKARQLAEQQQSDKFVREANQVQMEDRVSDMQEIKSLMEKMKQSLSAKPKETAGATQRPPSEKTSALAQEKIAEVKKLSEKPSLNPLDLLEQAKNIAAQTQDIRDSIKAEHLAEIMNIPIDDALASLDADSFDMPEREAIQKALASLDDLPDGAIKEAIKHYHDQARKNLEDTHEEEKIRLEGLSINLADMGNISLLYTSDAADELLCGDLGRPRTM